MPATVHIFDDEESCDTAFRVDRADADREDSYWRRAYWHERYYSTGLDYEDYAPAYCVGYIGHAQYGGNYEDAQRCLWANWVRIKGDSRLSMDEAGMAIRAAWDRMAGRRNVQAAKRDFGAGRRRSLKMPSFESSPAGA